MPTQRLLQLELVQFLLRMVAGDDNTGFGNNKIIDLVPDLAREFQEWKWLGWPRDASRWTGCARSQGWKNHRDGVMRTSRRFRLRNWSKIVFAIAVRKHTILLR